MSQGYQPTSRDGSDPRPPPPYDNVLNVDPWAVPEGREPLLGGQNQTYGTVEPQGGQYMRAHRLGKARPRGLMVVCCIVAVSLLLSCGFWGYHLNDLLNQKEHDDIRRQWAEEKQNWRKEWAVEEQKHQARRAVMDEEHRKWDRESRAIEQDRARWGRERREKEVKERRDQEEDAKKRAAIAWVGLEAGHCLRYRLKEYTATLSYVPLGVDGIQECWNKSIEMHGKEWFPTQCEDQGLCGRVTGHWEVDIDEPSCTPRWDYPVDKGCAESGYRRFEARLLDFPDTVDWPVICRTAPTQISGTWYDGPTSCERWYGNIWGKWLVNDDTCR